MKEGRSSQRFDKSNDKNTGKKKENIGVSFIQEHNIGLSYFSKF